MYIFNDFQEAKKHLYTGHWKYGRNLTMVDFVSDRTLETIALKWVDFHIWLLKIWLEIENTKCYNII